MSDTVGKKIERIGPYLSAAREGLAARARGLVSEVRSGFDGNANDRAFVQPEPALVRDFKPDASQIEDAPPPYIANAVLYGVILLIVSAVIWAVFGTVDRIVVAHGKIVTTTPVVVMQAFGTSRIQAMHVHAGDRVHQGDPLVTFDPDFAQADLSSLQARVRNLQAQDARIRAELADNATFDIGSNPSAEERVQADIFRDHTAQLATELAKRDSAISQTNATISADRSSIAAVERQEAIAKRVAGIHRYLYEQKAGALLQVIQSESAEIDVELHLKDLRADLQKMTDQLDGQKAERQTFLDDWKRQLNEKLADADEGLNEARSDLSKARKLREFAVMQSPIDGTVLEVADRSMGSVVREAETLVTIVPSNAILEVEADIPSSDAENVRVNDPVFLKLEAYPFQRYGTLDGRLAALSPDSVSRKAGDSVKPVFPARIRFDQSLADLARQGIHLGPGLVVTAEIKTGRRSIATYVTYPLIKSWKEGMREP